MKTVILASGGTGGHIFPAEALASNLLNEGYQVILITDKRYNRSKTTPDKLQVACIKSSSLQGGVLKKIKALFLISYGVLSAMKVIIRSKAKVVVGFGAYPSFPTMIAGIILNKKTIIHEQNSVLGKVNKIISKYVTQIALSFEKTKFIPSQLASKTQVTGNPVRPEIEKFAKLKSEDKLISEDSKTDAKINLLIVGGSLGATFFSTYLPQTIISLPQNIKDRLVVVQQCRKEDLEAVEQIYIQNNINHQLDSFFSDIAEKIHTSDLVISRAGASSIFEIIALKKPSILIPFKHALDNHQQINADFLTENNAAICFSEDDFNEKEFTNTLGNLLSNTGELQVIKNNIAKIDYKDASLCLSKIVKGFYI